MPTISQLAPVTAASDADEFPISQAGSTRKVTRAQILAGVQQEIVAESGTLLGRSSKTSGSPEQVTIGQNLILSSGTLSAAGGGYIVSALPVGAVPTGSDLIGISQDGKNVSVQYRQLMSGLAQVPNVDVSNAVVVLPGTEAATTLSEAVGTRMPMAGGSMTGVLTLSADPTAQKHAATKSYVDTSSAARVARSGGTMTGLLTLSGAPTQAAHAATKAYVDSVATGGGGGGSVLGGTLVGVLTLAADPAAPLDAATKQYVDVRVRRGGDTLTGALSLAGDPVSADQAATKRYVDAQVDNGIPRAGGTMTGALGLSGDPSSALQAATKQYADARVAKAGDTMTGALVLASDPVSNTHAANKNYVDTRTGLALAKAGGTLSGALTLHADPTAVAHAATKRYVDQQIGLTMTSAGGTVTGALSLAAEPTQSAHAANKSYVDGALEGALAKTGGTVTGALSLTTLPTSPQHAANKQYVDANPGRDKVINVTLPPYNAKLDGTSDDTAAFKAAYQDAIDGAVIYVPKGTTVLQSPDSWGVALTKRVKWLVDGTTTANGAVLGDCIPGGTIPTHVVLPGVVVGHSSTSASVSRGRSQTNDLTTFHTSCLINHDGGSATVLANARTDTLVFNSPANFVWGGVDRLVWVGKSTPDAAAPAQHVGRYVQTIRQTVYADAEGVSPPQPELWAACLEYRDVTGRPSSVTGASLTVEMDWIGNGPDDAKNRQIQSLVIAQHNKTGEPVDVSTVVGVYLAAGSKGQAQKVFNIGIPFSSAVLDTTHSVQLAGAAAIRMAAGHAIAFEPSGSNRLAYDSTTGTLKWHQGTQSFAVGKGISVGWQNVATTNLTLGGYLAGNIVFLAGAGVYTVTLPQANTVTAGTGFTFSAVGSGSATIAPASGESIELGPVTLRTHDRYHVVSDGVSSWREIFRTNAVSPRFLAPPVLPSYVVATLPTSVQAGAKAFASNGRKPSEAAGSGTGVEVFYDGTRWISVCGGSQVAA